MLTFAICLGCAGLVLSLFARLPAFLAVLAGTVLAVLAAGTLSLFGVVLASSTFGNIVVAIVALQFGYGLGIVARALLQRLMTSRGDHRPKISRVSPMRNAAIRRDPGANHSQGE